MKRLYIFTILIFNGLCLLSQKGLIDEQGEIIIPFEYNEISPTFDSSVLIVIKDNKFGMMNTKGDLLIPIEYKQIAKFHKHKLFLSTLEGGKGKRDKKGIIDTLGNIIVDADYFTDIKTFSGKIFYGHNARGGAIFTEDGDTLQKKTILGLKFLSDSIYSISNRNNVTYYHVSSETPIKNYSSKIDKQLAKNLYVIKKERKYGLRDSTFRAITPIIYQTPILATGGNTYIGYLGSHKYHLLNAKGKILGEFIDFDYISSCKKGYCIFKKNNFFGLMSASGKITVPEIYKELSYLSDSNYLVQKDEKKGIINSINEVVVPIEYNKLYPVRTKKKNSLLPFMVFAKNDKQGLLNKKYEEIILDSIMDTQSLKMFDKFISYERNDGTSVLKDESLQDYMVFESEVDFITVTPTGNMMVRQTKEFGPSDNANEIFYPIMKQKFGVVNRKNERILPKIYNGLSTVRERGKYIAYLKNANLYYNPKKKGKCVLSANKSEVYDRSFDLHFVENGNETTFKNALHLTETENNYIVYPNQEKNILPQQNAFISYKKENTFKELLTKKLINEVIVMEESENLVCEKLKFEQKFREKYPVKKQGKVEFQIINEKYDGENLLLVLKIRNLEKYPIILGEPEGLVSKPEEITAKNFPFIFHAKISKNYLEPDTIDQFIDLSVSKAVKYKQIDTIAIFPNEERELSIKLNLYEIESIKNVSSVDVQFVYFLPDEVFTNLFIYWGRRNLKKIKKIYKSVDKYYLYLDKFYKRKIMSNIVRVDL